MFSRKMLLIFNTWFKDIRVIFHLVVLSYQNLTKNAEECTVEYSANRAAPSSKIALSPRNTHENTQGKKIFTKELEMHSIASKKHETVLKIDMRVFFLCSES